HRGVEHRRVALLRVAARLQPAAELAVIDDEKRGAVGARHDRAAGDVALRVTARERIRRSRDEPPQPLERGLLLGRRRRVIREGADQLLPLHARRSSMSAVQSSESVGSVAALTAAIRPSRLAAPPTRRSKRSYPSGSPPPPATGASGRPSLTSSSRSPWPSVPDVASYATSPRTPSGKGEPGTTTEDTVPSARRMYGSGSPALASVNAPVSGS